MNFNTVARQILGGRFVRHIYGAATVVALSAAAAAKRPVLPKITLRGRGEKNISGKIKDAVKDALS